MKSSNRRKQPGLPCEEIRREMASRVSKRLPAYLKLDLASPGDVLILISSVLSRNGLLAQASDDVLAAPAGDAEPLEVRLERKVDEICRGAAASGYVRDCEFVARYNSPETSDSVKEQIRNYYWENHFVWTCRILRARLMKCLGKRKTEVHYAAAQDLLEDAVFSGRAFGRCVSQYRPAKGKSLEEFLKWLVLRRSTDCVNRLMKSEKRLEGAVRALSTNPPIQPDEESVSRIRESLVEYLAELKKRSSPRDRKRGIRERAVIELRYLAYLDPADMDTDTVGAVGRHSPGGIESLRKDYLTTIGRLQILIDERLPDALHRADQAYAAMVTLRQELEQAGCPMHRLDSLRFLALRKDSGDGGDNPATGPHDGSETVGKSDMEYVKACRRHDRELHRLESARGEWSDWCRCRGAWVRCEKEIGALIGVSQSTVSRTLEAATEFASTLSGLRRRG